MPLHPDFFCVAAQKTGTSWLYDQARSHPGVWMPPIKELRFFNSDSSKLKERAEARLARRGGRALDDRDREFLRRAATFQGVLDTADLTQYTRLFEPAGDLVTGDVSPANHRLGATAIAQLSRGLPDCKFLLLLRDPVARLWSQVNMQVRGGKASAEALTDPAQFEDLVKHPMFVEHSFQSQAIHRWREIVGEQRFRVFVMDDLVSDPPNYRRAIFSYIGLRADDCTIPADYNKKANDQKLPLPAVFYGFLNDYFAEEYDALDRLIGGKWVSQWRSKTQSKGAAASTVSRDRVAEGSKVVAPQGATSMAEEQSSHLISKLGRFRAKGRTRPDFGIARSPRRWWGSEEVQSTFPIDYEPSVHEKEILKFFRKKGAGEEFEFARKAIPSTFICFTNRSGSNYLAELLASTGKLPLAGEWFNWPNVINFSERREAKSFRHFCHLLARGTSRNGRFASKIGCSQLYFLSRSRVIPELFGSPHFIFVRRRDVLGQSISYLIAKQTGQWTSNIPRKRQPAAPANVVYDGQAIARHIRSISATNARFEEYFATFNFPMMEVVYEDLVADEAQKISAITDWLGLGPTSVEREEVRLKPQRSSLNDEWRARFLSERTAYFANEADEQAVELARQV